MSELPTLSEESDASRNVPTERPAFREAFQFWLRLGFISFGGPAGQIAIMHTELVERRGWISEAQFLRALNFCMLLPGPEAQQVATYLGWLLHRTRGGLAAGILFVLPSGVLLWLLSWVYVGWGTLPWMGAFFYGLKPAVLAIVGASLLKITRKALHGAALIGIACLAFVLLAVLRVPFPFVLMIAAAVGWFGGEFWKDRFLHSRTTASAGAFASLESGDGQGVTTVNGAGFWRRVVRVLGTWLIIWWGPILLIGVVLGWEHTLFREGVFFAKAALVTFGGAYAVLPYVSQQAVAHFGWLSGAQMLDGLGLAETTPGPLIMVLQFVGFLGGWNQPGNLPPFLSASLGALITTWSTFVPCFLWIFLGAPYVERLRDNERLSCVLAALSAVVVGGIANLSAWFGAQVLWPEGMQMDLFAVVLTLAAFVALVRFKWSIPSTVLGAGFAGVLWKLFA